MRRSLAFALVLLSAAALVSCSSSGGSDPGDTQRPTIDTSTPADGATDQSLVQSVELTFSEAMDAETISDTTLLLAGRTPVPHVRYDETTRTATITPDTLFAAETWHEVVVTEEVTDLAGNPAWPETLSFQTGTFDADHLADFFEPNESTAEASPVDVGGTCYSLTGTYGDKDTYEFTVDERSRVTFKTPIKAAPPDDARWVGWQIHFMRADGEHYSTMGTNARPGQTPQFGLSFDPGTHYCEVYSSYGMQPEDFVLYDLEVVAGTPCDDDPFEPNDFDDEAAPITEGMHSGLRGCYLDKDYFSIEMASGETLTVTLDATFLPGDWEHRRMRIDAPGGDYCEYNGTGNPTVGQVTATAAGTATICITFWEDDVDYTLDVELSN